MALFKKTDRIVFNVSPNKKEFIQKVCDRCEVQMGQKARELFLQWIDEQAQRLGLEEP